MNLDIQLIESEFINQMPGLLAVFDLNHRFITGNKNVLKWTGFRSMDEMIGTTYGDIPCKASEQHENFVAQDQAILKNHGRGKILGLYCYNNNDWKVILAEKFPLKNKDNQICALASYIIDLTNLNVVDINKFLSFTSGNNLNRIIQTGYLVQDQPFNTTLSSRQSECLFFILRGKTAKEISHLLNLSVLIEPYHCCASSVLSL